MLWKSVEVNECLSIGNPFMHVRYETHTVHGIDQTDWIRKKRKDQSIENYTLRFHWMEFKQTIRLNIPFWITSFECSTRQTWWLHRDSNAIVCVFWASFYTNCVRNDALTIKMYMRNAVKFLENCMPLR